MGDRFIIKYCNVLDSVFLLDTLKRMPLTMVISNHLYVHGLDCNDRETAEDIQSYYESVCGFQRTLFPVVTSFEIKVEMTTRGTFREKGDEIPHYDIYDNTGKHIIGSYDKELIEEFMDWLMMELDCYNQVPSKT